MSYAEHEKHQASCADLLTRLALPLSDATALAWFDGKDRKIVLWVKRKAWNRIAAQVPASFDGYPVVIEDYRVAGASAAAPKPPSDRMAVGE